MSVQKLANLIATAVKEARSTVGAAERATVSGESVVTSHGVYGYDLACPINIYDGKVVWVQISQDGTAVIVGD